MGYSHLILLIIAVVSPLVISRPEFYESYEGGLRLSDYSVEDSFEDESSSDEIPLAGLTYNPFKDGDPDAFLDKFKESNSIEALPNEDGIREMWRKLYKEAQGKPLPKVTSADRKKIDKKLNDAELMKHNEFRAENDAEPLEYDEQLAAFAQNYVEAITKKMAQGYPFKHNQDGEKYQVGENMLTSTDPETYDGQGAKSWYQEKPAYIKYGVSENPETRHYTQLVWKASKKMGCGTSAVKSPGGGPPTKYVSICNYYPGGNMKNGYEENVSAE